MFVSLNTLQAATRVSVADGLWSSTATWGGTLPAATDDVVVTHAVSLTSALAMNSLDISSTGTLSVDPVTVQVKGNFTLHPGGTFNAGTSTMRFNGSTSQTISGSPTFHVLRADNTGLSTDADAVVAVDPIVCLSSLIVNDGQFMMTDGQVNDIYVAGNAGVVFKPLPGATITVTGANAGTAFNRIGSFIHNDSKFIFAGSGRQVVTSGSFYDLEVANTAPTPSATDEVELSVSVANNFLISDGQASTAQNNATKDLTVESAGRLRLRGDFRVTGNMVLNGTVEQGAFSVLLYGSAAQTMSGALNFSALTISNFATASDANAVIALSPVTVSGQLYVSRGQFMPPSGSQFGNIFVANQGVLKPEAGATITVTSATGTGVGFERWGGFIHNGGKVVFAGSARQTAPNALTFHDLEIANTAATPSATDEVELVATVTNHFEITDGQASVGHLNTVKDFTVGAAGILRLRGDMRITGNMVVNGTLDQSTFSPVLYGNVAQTLSGTLNFTSLTINNFGGVNDASAVVPASALTVTGQVNVARGQLTVPTGSQFGNVYIASQGGLKAEAGATITVASATGTGVAFERWGTFTPNGGKVVFTGSGRQTIPNSVTFHDLEIANTAASPDSTNEVELTGTASNDLLVTQGQLSTPAGTMKNVTVGPAGRLRYRGQLNLTGNFANNGALNDAGFRTRFSGVGAQLMSGTLEFSELEIDNNGATSDATAVTAASPIVTTGVLAVTRGQFVPPDGSQFNNIAIAGYSSAHLKPAVGATITITGADGSGNAFTKAGAGATFTHNNSKVIFASSGRQVVSIETLYDVEIANSAVSPDSTNEVELGAPVANLLTVSDGQVSLSGTCASLTVGPAGRVRYRGQLNLTRNLMNNGVLDAAGFHTRINGTGPQSLSGNLEFPTLEISNASAVDDATAVTFTDPIITTGTLTVTFGQFMPPDGSEFNDITISGNSGSRMKPVAGATITVTGANGSGAALTNFGTSSSFIHNNSRFVFAGSARQTVPSLVFWDIEVANTAPAPDSTNEVACSGTVVNSLTITDGQFSFGSSNTFVNLAIAPAGILRLGGVLNLTGNLAAHGGFLNNGFATRFVGGGQQLVSGSPTFATVQVQNNAAPPSDTDAVIFQDAFTATGLFDVNRGRALIADGTTVNEVFINLGASFRPAAGARLTVTGSDGSGIAFASYGDFAHNNGTVVMAGSGPQSFLSNPVFWNLEIANTAAVPSASAEVALVGTVVGNELMVLDGQASVGTDTLSGPVTVASDGILRLRESRSFSGDVIVDGAVDTSAATTVTFSGSGTQNLTATVPGTFPLVRVLSGTTLVEDGTANATATGLDVQGTLRRSLASVPSGIVGGGLTGTTVNVTTLGTLTTLSIDRIGTVANAAPQHATADASFTFDAAGATGYTVDLTLPHALATPANAQVSSYLGSGTNWDFAQSSFTANSVTRTGLTSLASVWAVGDSTLTAVEEWRLLND